MKEANKLNPDMNSEEKGELEVVDLEVTIDEAIQNHVGSFGFAQFLHVTLVSLAWIFDSQNTLVTIFSDAQPGSWICKTNTPSSSCIAASGKGAAAVCTLEPGTWEWVGGAGSSIIAEWDLICNRRFLAAIPASCFFIGSLLGSAFNGRLADSYLGRKKTILLSCVLTSITTFLTSYAPNVWIYAFLRSMNGFSRSGIGICCLVLSTEVIGRKWRGQVGQYGFLYFTGGFFSLPFIAYQTRGSWRNLYKILSIFPLAYCFLLVPFVFESPRWLLIRGRNEEALDVLKVFARLNRKKLPTNLTLKNPLPVNETNHEESLWKTKWAAKRMVTVMLAGFGVGFVYYGVQLNVENLNFNLYYSVGLNALMEIPAVLIGSLLLAFVNRRLLFAVSTYVAGVSCILCIFISSQKASSGGSWGQLIIESIGFMAASISFDVMYIYCVELFPTNVRNFAVSMLRQTLMLGASIAPLLVVVGRLSPSISFIIFGVLSIFSGTLSLLLPETKNAPLYDTLKQQQEEEISIRNTTTPESASA
ncbi:hypothetical protein ACFE04_012034 [Oxalis oulophora]